MSEPTAEARRPPPDPIDFNPEPPVTRLNRRVFGVIGVALSAALLAAVFTLSQRSDQIERQNAEASRPTATPDRFWEAESDGAPSLLAPPENVPELVERESPLLEAGSAFADGSGLAATPEDQALERARRSPIVALQDREGPTPSEPASQLPAAEDAFAGVVASEPSPIDQSVLGGLGSAEDPVVAQNLQDRKREFLRDAATPRDEALSERVHAAASPYTLLAGTVIPAVLITEARSDLPGQLIAQVREAVFDTATGAHVLIPQGTRALGEYDSVVAFGQERILVAWQRLLFPDGSSLALRGMPGTDAAGAAGLHDRVDRHLLRTFGSAALLSAISAGAQISQGTFGQGTSANDTTDAREIFAAALGQNLSDLGSEITRRNLSVQPSLQVRAGYRFNISVVKDIVLPGPWKAPESVAVRAIAEGDRQ